MGSAERQGVGRRAMLIVAKVSGALVFGSAVLPVFVQDVDSDFVCSNVVLHELGLVDIDGSACGQEKVYDDRAEWTVRFLLIYSCALTAWAVPAPETWMSDWR